MSECRYENKGTSLPIALDDDICAFITVVNLYYHKSRLVLSCNVVHCNKSTVKLLLVDLKLSLL